MEPCWDATLCMAAGQSKALLLGAAAHTSLPAHTSVAGRTGRAHEHSLCSRAGRSHLAWLSGSAGPSKALLLAPGNAAVEG